jgi:hypothetical protein
MIPELYPLLIRLSDQGLLDSLAQRRRSGRLRRWLWRFGLIGPPPFDPPQEEESSFSRRRRISIVSVNWWR